jgi:DNA-binding MurR/RpiR family transcriptional regulator
MAKLEPSASAGSDPAQRLLHASRVGDATTSRLAAWLLKERDEALGLPISRFAQQVGVTETTITRFCKTLGYSGYRELRLALVQSLGVSKGIQLRGGEHETLEPADGSILSLAKRVIANNADILLKTTQLVDARSLERATMAFSKADHVHLVGFGSSAPVALDFYQRLLRLGIHANVYSDPHILTVITANLQPASILFGITYSGQSRDLVEALRAAKTKGATTIVLTSNGGATAARLSDILLISAVDPELAGRESVATRISQMAIVDILFTSLTLNHPNRSAFVEGLERLEREITRVRAEEH